MDLARARLPGGRALPPGSEVPPIELANRDDVPVLWGAVDAAQRTALITPLVVLGLLGFAVAMSRRRWLTLGVAGAVLAGVSLFLLELNARGRSSGGVSTPWCHATRSTRVGRHRPAAWPTRR